MPTIPLIHPSAHALRNPLASASGLRSLGVESESERFLQSTLNALSAHLAILDGQGFIVAVNAAWNEFARQNNYVGSDYGIGVNYLRLCGLAVGNCSAEAPAVAKGIRAVMAGQCGEFVMEYPCHSPQEQRWFAVRVTRFAGDGPARVVVAHETITARRRAEDSLVASEQRLRLALEAGNLGVFEHTLSDDRLLVSPELCRILELPLRTSIPHDEWVERMHPEDRSRVLAGVQRMLSEQSALDLDYRLCLPNGNVRWIRAMASPVVEHGTIGRVHGVVQDITERKESESGLRKLSRAIEQSPVSVVITDLQGGIEYVNPGFCAVTGYNFEEVRGKNPRLLKSGETPAESNRRMWAAITAGEEWHGEFHNRKKNGELYWESASISPIRDDQGKVTHFVAVKADITERKRGQAKIEELQVELLEASRRAGRSEIATNVLHNVGNVLNSVNISAGLVVQSVKTSKVASLAKVTSLLREHAADLGEFMTHDCKGKLLPAYLAQLSSHLISEQASAVRELDALQRSVDHINEIVVMQQKYATSGGRKETIHVANLVEESLRMHEALSSLTRLEVVREFEEVPPIHVEKHKILQILVNLLRNATQACQESERTDRRMTVRVAKGNGRITIAVADNGVGISSENLTRVFNHGFTTRQGGHGFGLHSAALAANELGGSLTVYSAGPGQGAVFTLELPGLPRENPHELARATVLVPHSREPKT